LNRKVKPNLHRNVGTYYQSRREKALRHINVGGRVA